MIVRIVKMTFQEDKTEEFLEIFHASKQAIRQFAGCLHLELLQDVKEKNRYYTYSYWRSEEALEQYRLSELFRETWSRTKVLFAAKPEAFSLVKVTTVDSVQKVGK